MAVSNVFSEFKKKKIPKLTIFYIPCGGKYFWGVLLFRPSTWILIKWDANFDESHAIPEFMHVCFKDGSKSIG